jgi:hypothetical protein
LRISSSDSLYSQATIFLEIGAANRDLTSYTRQKIESRLLEQYAPWYGNGTKAQAVLKIWEDNYLLPGTADDDHLAWLQFIVDVRYGMRSTNLL